MSGILVGQTGKAQAESDWKGRALKFVAEAGGCAALLAEVPLKAIITDFSDSTLAVKVKVSSGKSVFRQLPLGRRFGAGFFGGFYVLQEKATPELAKFDGQLGVKIPHVVKGFSIPLKYAVKEAAKELKMYENLKAQWHNVESQLDQNQNYYWKNGRIPVVPIVDTWDTDRGLLIFKPSITKGVFLNQIAKEYAEQGILPQKYQESIVEMYSLIQAIYQGTGLSIDIRPTNWVYIEDIQMMESLNLKRPGFVLFEMSQVPFNLPKYIEPGFTVSQFIQEFIKYLEKENRN